MFPAAGESLAMYKSHEDRLCIEGNGLVELGSDIRIIGAKQGDLDRVLEILEEASRWLISKGLETQWLPSPAFRQTIRDNIDHGEVYVAKDVKETVGTILSSGVTRSFGAMYHRMPGTSTSLRSN